MRTVDIDKAMIDIANEIVYWQEKQSENASYSKFIISALEFCLEKLESCPTISAGEANFQSNSSNTRTRARWKYAGDSGYYSPYFECSNCKVRSKNVSAYCPNCGSEME